MPNTTLASSPLTQDEKDGGEFVLSAALNPTVDFAIVRSQLDGQDIALIVAQQDAENGESVNIFPVAILLAGDFANDVFPRLVNPSDLIAAAVAAEAEDEPDWDALSDGRAVGDDLADFRSGYYDGLSGTVAFMGEPDPDTAYDSGYLAGVAASEG